MLAKPSANSAAPGPRQTGRRYRGLTLWRGWFRCFALGFMLAVLCGCQSFATRRLGVMDMDLTTRGLAGAAATGDPSACAAPQVADSGTSTRPPAELAKMALSPYRLEPPDILIVGLISAVPKEPYYLKSLDIVRIIAAGTLEEEPIAGDYNVQPGGIINLGPSYGSVKVEGLTLSEARDAIARQLAPVIPSPAVSITLVRSSQVQLLAGEKVVAPDGTVNLGIYGNVYVAGMTVNEARRAMEQKLSEYFEEPRVSLDVLAYNSKTYYIIVEGAGFGDQVFEVPVTGNETVLDAIANVRGTSPASSRRIWISRPAPDNVGCYQIIPVDWLAVTRGGDTSTNYQILPGDRVFVAEDRLFAISSLVGNVLNPIERAFGFTLLGAQSLQGLARFPRGGAFFFQGFQ